MSASGNPIFDALNRVLTRSGLTVPVTLTSPTGTVVYARGHYVENEILVEDGNGRNYEVERSLKLLAAEVPDIDAGWRAEIAGASYRLTSAVGLGDGLVHCAMSVANEGRI